MTDLKIGEYRTADKVSGKLRVPLTGLEIEKYVLYCLKPDKSPGPDKYPKELVKTMTVEEFLIVRAWVNEI